MAECNNLGRGPVVFELQQAGITAIRHKAAGAPLLLLPSSRLRESVACGLTERLARLFCSLFALCTLCISKLSKVCLPGVPSALP